MSLHPVRRVVTGHDADGQAIIAADGRLPTVVELSAVPGTIFHEVWSTQGSPARIDNGPDPSTGPIQLPPPRHGTRIRFVDIPPDTENLLRQGTEKMKDAFQQIGDAGASTVKTGSPHPLMHRTETIDYGIVIAGEITLLLDKGETLLKEGDVVIQRGTNHAWANRTGKPCRMLFILVDGKFDPGLPDVSGAS